jgi:hypothetical protein
MESLEAALEQFRGIVAGWEAPPSVPGRVCHVAESGYASLTPPLAGFPRYRRGSVHCSLVGEV